ncbi:MAG: YggS family pyridoxal phosphate-dependent enzyme [Candidatus Omnitrophica bacterium]|nr:YggS family pyridoxal phosphate-dependent enzyme [Candidatus Omnitrophota bacterium]
MVGKNLEEVRSRIRRAALAVGRDPVGVRLVCVTKGIPTDKIQEALFCGVADLGENRVQEAAEKQPVLGRKPTWHLIGHLQRNKVKTALEIFDVIHSLDRLELAESIQKSAQTMGRGPVRVLVQVNAARAEGRYGVSPEQTADLVERVKRMDRLRLEGLMVMAPFAQDPEEARPVFRSVRELAASLGLAELSMGMSNDFEVAVQEGATMVRVGTAIFGERAQVKGEG